MYVESVFMLSNGIKINKPNLGQTLCSTSLLVVNISELLIVHNVKLINIAIGFPLFNYKIPSQDSITRCDWCQSNKN